MRRCHRISPRWSCKPSTVMKRPRVARPLLLITCERCSDATRVGWALALVLGVWFGVNQQRQAARHELATGLATLANVAAVPDPKALEDMEAIQQLSSRPAPEDEELFKVLSQ